jgi:uncharacterized LabA/DUF88 family protein
MTVSSANRTALFIDGANLYSTAKALGFDIDCKRLLEEFQSHGTLVRAFYYTAVTEDKEFTAVRPLLAWLDYDGSAVDTKPTKEFIDANGHRKVKGNMDIELTVGAMETASITSCFSRLCCELEYESGLPRYLRQPKLRQARPTPKASGRLCTSL